ncbi:MAG: hypothetical protein QOJ27_2942, partial [Sphingomonadales bacterium]|nr:hypothetical protein [Sphingomonadales bacterium]
MNRAGLGDGARSFVYAPRKNKGSSQFQRLFNLTVRHTYYTLNSGLCPDFRVAPTPATAKLMASLGLAFKDECTGFSVFYQTGMLEGIYAYLRREAADAPENHPGYWSRLTFLMKVVNPQFLGVTALPIEVTPVRCNLYGCNRDAHFVETDGEEEVAVLSRGEFMTGDALYGLVGNELDLNVPDETALVTISDISGAVVL